MTAFARKVLSELPEPTSAGAANNYSILQEFANDNDKSNVKVDVQVTRALNAFAPLRLSRRRHLRPAAAAAAVGRRRQRLTYVTNKQLAAGFTWTRDGRRCSKAASAGRGTVAGKNPPALGHAGALRGLRHHRAADRRRASPAACRRS